MIPIAFVAGLIGGRWWLGPIVGVAWLGIVLGVNDDSLSSTPAAFALGTTNALTGIALHKAILRLLRKR